MGLLGEFLYFLRKSLESCVHAEIFKDVHIGNAQEQLTFPKEIRAILKKSRVCRGNRGNPHGKLSFLNEIIGILK